MLENYVIFLINLDLQIGSFNNSAKFWGKQAIEITNWPVNNRNDQSSILSLLRWWAKCVFMIIKNKAKLDYCLCYDRY